MQDQILQSLSGITILLVNLLLALAAYYIKKLTDKVRIQSNANLNAGQKVLVDNALSRLDDLVQKSVVATQETIGKEIKEMVLDGKVEKKELLALKDNVITDVKEQLSEELTKSISLEITDIDKYISNQIENALLKIK